ncbi:hypothetical protein JCM18903_562 [Psychrobacter sp. JCM 18903]|nr:hypothetical protein JCM18903_562 [Psychrobacter sp. JCM 18903]
MHYLVSTTEYINEKHGRNSYNTALSIQALIERHIRILALIDDNKRPLMNNR